MSKTYWLPCSCGARIPVEASRAGQLVPCVCGASLEVPTLRGLTALEIAEPTGRGAPARPWGLRQRLYLVGLLLFLAGIAGGAYVGSLVRDLNQHKVAHDKLLDKSFDDLQPDDLWQIWRYLRQGLPDLGADPTAVAARRHELHRWLYAALTLAGVGLAVAACGLLVPQGNAMRAANKESRR